MKFSNLPRDHPSSFSEFPHNKNLCTFPRAGDPTQSLHVPAAWPCWPLLVQCADKNVSKPNQGFESL